MNKHAPAIVYPAAVKLYYSLAYVGSACEFDTTRKAAWVAKSLVDHPIDGVEIVAPIPVSVADLQRVHGPVYVEAVRTGQPQGLAESQGLTWDAGLWDAVCASTGGAVAAALGALAAGGNTGSLSSGLHHARHNHGAGFCTFNGLALATYMAAVRDASVLIVDLDAHCGGGTHEILARLPGAACIDVAVDSFDRYKSRRPGWTLDIVRHAADYLPTIRRRLTAALRPDLVLYNAGMDPHEDCLTSGLKGLTAALIGERERIVFEWARGLGVPVAFVLAGGYVGRALSKDRVVDLHRLTIEAAVSSR